MKFIKYKQVARITLYGFDDLYRNNTSSVYTEPLNSIYFTQNTNGGVQMGNNAKRMRFQIKGLDNVKLSEHARFCLESINIPVLYDANDDCSRWPNIDNNVIYQNLESSPVFYNPYPEILYNFPISSNFLNNRYFDFSVIMQFMPGDFIDLPSDQITIDAFCISFIVYDLDEEELLLTSTQDVDFKKFGETLPRKINNIR